MMTVKHNYFGKADLSQMWENTCMRTFICVSRESSLLLFLRLFTVMVSNAINIKKTNNLSTQIIENKKDHGI
jgi:hypothetical protein